MGVTKNNGLRREFISPRIDRYPSAAGGAMCDLAQGNNSGIELGRNLCLQCKELVSKGPRIEPASSFEMPPPSNTGSPASEEAIFLLTA